MVKKMVKREAPTSYPVVGEDRAMLRHHSLLQDYQDLVKETEAQRQGLLKAHQKKLKLLAEVRFLRRKLNSFTDNPSLKNPHRAKNRACNPATPSARYACTPNYVVPTKAHLVDGNYKAKGDAVPATTILLDLNQDAEELEWDPPRTQSMKKCPVDNGALANDLKLSLCRDMGNEANQAGRRKISWQDQLSLRV